MAEASLIVTQIKLTKNELRDQQFKLGQLQKYLPTLQLKKAMLQAEVNNAQTELDELTVEYEKIEKSVERFQSLLTDVDALNVFPALEIKEVVKTYENIAGVDIPSFKQVVFHPPQYVLFDTGLWIDQAITELQSLSTARQKILVVEEKKKALEKELREVSIRVNLFEKIMIPRTLTNIKKIKVFLGDQQLAAVATSKVAKQKVLLRKQKALEEEYA